MKWVATGLFFNAGAILMIGFNLGTHESGATALLGAVIMILSLCAALFTRERKAAPAESSRHGESGA